MSVEVAENVSNLCNEFFAKHQRKVEVIACVLMLVLVFLQVLEFSVTVPKLNKEMTLMNHQCKALGELLNGTNSKNSAVFNSAANVLPERSTPVPEYGPTNEEDP